MITSLNVIITLMILIGMLTLITAVRNNLLLVVFFQIAFIGLVTSQAAWFVFAVLDNVHNSYVLGYSYFGVQDAFFSALLFLAFQIGILITTLYVTKKYPRFLKISASRFELCNNQIIYSMKSMRETVIYSLIAMVFGSLMILNAGGFANFIYEPGSMLPGQTFFLFAIGILKWNILNRLMHGIPITWESKLYFVIYLFFSLFTSRFMTVFALIQLTIFWHYYFRPINKLQLLKSVTPILIVVMVFGVYRDIAHKGLAIDLGLTELMAAMLDFLPGFLEWFFSNNTEIFSGVTNSLRQLREGSEINFLLPELSVFFFFLPNFIRTDENLIFNNLMNYIKSTGIQSNSVIESGFERYLIGLDVIGFAVYSIILLWFLSSAEVSLRKGRRSFVTIASVQAINGLRGSLPGSLLYFGIADFIASKVFRICLVTNIVNTRTQ